MIDTWLFYPYFRKTAALQRPLLFITQLDKPSQYIPNLVIVMLMQPFNTF